MSSKLSILFSKKTVPGTMPETVVMFFTYFALCLSPMKKIPANITTAYTTR